MFLPLVMIVQVMLVIRLSQLYTRRSLPNFDLSVHTRELEELKKLETNVFLARIQDGAPFLVVDGKLCFL